MLLSLIRRTATTAAAAATVTVAAASASNPTATGATSSGPSSSLAADTSSSSSSSSSAASAVAMGTSAPQPPPFSPSFLIPDTCTPLGQHASFSPPLPSSSSSPSSRRAAPLHHTKLVTVVGDSSGPGGSGNDGSSGEWTRPPGAEFYTRPDLANLRVKAFFESSPSAVVAPMASGRVIASIGPTVYAVELDNIHFSPVIEVGSRVFVEYGKDEEHQGVVHGGIVARVNGNGTLGIILDNNSIDMAVPPGMIAVSEGRAAYVNDDAYLAVVEWIRCAGVVRRVHQEAMACVLFQRGWRVDRLYLLEPGDVHCMTLIPKAVRMSILDKSEWQRDHHRQMRQLMKERVKEKDFRYRLTKYSGVVSASMAFLGISFAFGWNVKNYRRQQRQFQLSLAVEALTESSSSSLSPGGGGGSSSNTSASKDGKTSSEGSSSSTSGVDQAITVNIKKTPIPTSTPTTSRSPLLPHSRHSSSGAASAHAAAKARALMEAESRHFVERGQEEHAVREVLRRLDTAHPRIVVLTGYSGCGKSTVARAAIAREGVPAVHVDIRGSEDTLRSVVKAIGVENIDVCGDLLDFVAEACHMSKKISGRTPLLVLKLREGSNLRRVYNEAVALACDRRLCHLVIEVPMESLTMATASLPRLDFYMIPNFSPSQAYTYTQHSIDPVSLSQFIDVAGTNSNDLDELFAAVHQRRASPAEYTGLKLVKGMRLVHAACANAPQVRLALRQLAAFSFEDGQHAGVDATSLGRPALRDIVLYDPVRDTWRFRSKVIHTAARSCWI